MFGNSKFLNPRRLLVAVLLTAVAAAPAWAQERNLRSITFVTVKRDCLGNWKAAVKDYMALQKKAGWDQPITVWSSETGPRQYAFVEYSAKWKEVAGQDPPKELEADFARVLARLDACTTSMEDWVDQMQPDMTSPLGSEIPKFVRTGRWKALPGKSDALLEIFRNEAIPAVKKGGVKSFGVAVARYGTPTNELHTFVGLNGWEDFDAPFAAQRAMSADAYKEMSAKIGALTESFEYTIWRFRPELSYLPEMK